VLRPVLTFVLLGTLALALVATSGLFVIRRLADREALNEARQLTALSARIVQQRVTDGLITGDAFSSEAVASVVRDAVLREPVVRVKIWSEQGEILYSDETHLIGAKYTLGPEEEEVLDRGGVVAELSDLQAPENRYERSFGQLMEVYTRIETPSGTPLLFETYQRRSSILGTGRELASTFTPVLIVTLIALALLEVPLAWGLARRIRRSQAERERLMSRALAASDRERRQIAADLHDGPVQELSGLSMRLSATAERATDAASGDVLRDSASAIRRAVRTLRSAIVGVYPPDLQRAGLPAALSDLVTRLDRRGVASNLSVDPSVRFDPTTDELLYRAAQELLRNIEEHADAEHVDVSVRRDGDLAILEVHDDGRGISDAAVAEARAGGHMGLEILADRVRDAGGTLRYEPADHSGTLVRVEVPAP
jgi:two-component system, NarL family, sensor kinase